MSEWKPGDGILDRYMPNADEETRERAREVLRHYALHLIRLGERVLAEEERAAADSTEIAWRHTIFPSPDL